MTLMGTDRSQGWRRKALAVEPCLLVRDELFIELFLPEPRVRIPAVATSFEKILLRERRAFSLDNDAVFFDCFEQALEMRSFRIGAEAFTPLAQ